MGMTGMLARACDQLRGRASLLSDPLVGYASPRGELLALNHPTRAGSLGITAGELARFFEGRWSPGDVAVTNDPFLGSYGVGEFTAVRATAGGFVLARSWCGDVGGFARGGISPQAVDTWGEGARFTTLRVARARAWRQQAVDLLELNSRTPELLRASLRRLIDVTASLGEALRPGLGGAADLPAWPIRDLLGRLEPGTYHAEGQVELPDGAPGPTVRVALTVSAAALHFDLGGSDPQVERPAVNSPEGQTVDACLSALALACPVPAASRRPPAGIQIVCGGGTITGAVLPATTGLAPYLTGRTIRRAVLTAVGDAGGYAGEPDRWWAERGRARFRHEIDPDTQRLRPERIDEVAAEVLAEEGKSR